jgi:hypothetical protein
MKILLEDVLPRIGEIGRDRLAWVVETVQHEGKLTPGDQDNLALELAAFIWDGNPLPREHESRLRKYVGRIETSVEPLSSQQVAVVVDRLRHVIHAVARRDAYDAMRQDGMGRRIWDDLSGRWIAMPVASAPIDEFAAWALDRLILEHGHLVKACPAPALRAKDDAMCSRWFVAARPNQEYCSARCQSRATTRAARSGTATRATQQAQTRQTQQRELLKKPKRRPRW